VLQALAEKEGRRDLKEDDDDGLQIIAHIEDLDLERSRRAPIA
jgi:hypothetical protein